MDRWLEQSSSDSPQADAPQSSPIPGCARATSGHCLEPRNLRPHRHPQPNRWEMIHALQGETTLVLFDDHGHPTRKILLSPQVMPVVECPANTWHSLYPTQGQSVIMEVKEGPYLPNLPEHFAPWAPEENTPEVEAYLARTHGMGMPTMLKVLQRVSQPFTMPLKLIRPRTNFPKVP